MPVWLRGFANLLDQAGISLCGNGFAYIFYISHRQHPGVIRSAAVAYSRKTKLGRVEWNPGTLAGVLANERHCGDVLARKTFTPNFLTHKSKKNNNDRTQYRQKNHHEAIVSREVFNAANHLRASRNYSKKNRPLPVLSVVEDGILRGYVPFDKDWTGFSAEEYREASESVMKEPDVTVTADVKKRLDLTGYEIVRVQYFSTMQNPAMTISNGRLRFNTACLKKFENVEYHIQYSLYHRAGGCGLRSCHV